METDIWTAIYTQINTIVFSETLPKQWPNRIFDTPENGKYLEVIHLPNLTDSQTWGPEKHLMGIVRCNVHYPFDQGDIPPMQLCEQIAAAFLKGSKLYAAPYVVKFYDHPHIGGVIQDGQTVYYPVTIRYHAD